GLQSKGGRQSFIEVRKYLETLPWAERKAALTTHISTQAAKILGIKNPQQVSTEKRLVDLGLDSLMAIEFLSLLQSSLGVSLSSALLFEYPTVEAMVDYLFNDFVTSQEVNSLPVTQSKESKAALQGENYVSNSQYQSTIVANQTHFPKYLIHRIKVFLCLGVEWQQS
ncbi:MAG: acyl carrier protein, partial [Dolichospermum sp.]